MKLEARTVQRRLRGRKKNKAVVWQLLRPCTLLCSHSLCERARVFQYRDVLVHVWVCTLRHPQMNHGVEMEESVKLQTAVNNIIHRLGLSPSSSSSFAMTWIPHCTAPSQGRDSWEITQISTQLCSIFTADTQAIRRPLSSPRTQNATPAVRYIIQFPFARRRYYWPTSKCNASASRGHGSHVTLRSRLIST